MNLKSMTLAEVTAALKEMGQPAFRGKQVYSWLHKGVRSYDEMSNLSKELRTALAEKYPITAPVVVRKQESARDGTIKYLWKLADGNCVETVLMRYNYGNTVCISTEVGCRMGCAFCASTIGGLVRKLEPYEMLDEVLFTQIDSGLPISRVVLMGIGEPLDNYDNVIRFLHLVNCEAGLNIGYRHISLSTCGLIDRIFDLMKEELPITLSISLHAPDDETRSAIMPINNRYGVDDLLKACRTYYAHTGRRISFEYTLIAGKNDSVENAQKLARVLNSHLRSKTETMPIHVNLIPVNEVSETGFQKSGREAVQAFAKTLEAKGIRATVRRRLGADINASCGQLRRAAMKQ